jgi:hypothetical protein
MASSATPPAAHSTPPPQDRRSCDRIPEAASQLKRSEQLRSHSRRLEELDVTSLRWRSAGGSETVLRILDAVLGTHETSAPHWPYLIVLDGGQFSARCRFCRWISSPSQALLEVRSKGEEHACPGKGVRVPGGTTGRWGWARPIRRSGDLAATRPAGGGDATGYAPGSDAGT